MNIAAEFKAALPEPHLILGVRLLPLSIGRYCLLKRFDSPFVREDSIDCGPENLAEIFRELLFALMVCGLPVAEMKSLLLTPTKLEREAKRFGKVVQKIIRRTPDFSMVEPIKEFKAYMDEGCALPWHPLTREQDQRESISHWAHSIEVTLTSQANWDQDQINEEPLTKALAHFFKLLENQGHVNLITHEAYDAMEKMGESNAVAFLAHIKAMEDLAKQVN
jgi:hypothetical protein